jgi:UDP-glucose:(heptosyl)LPS alpha-1,3-glucosyltransferase
MQLTPTFLGIFNLMRVAIVQKDLKHLRSGVSRLVRAQIELLVSMGAEAHIVSEKVNREVFENTGAKVHKTFRWPFKGVYRRRFFRSRVQQKLQRLKPDMVIGHGDIVEQTVCFMHNCVHLEHELTKDLPLPSDDEMGIMHSEVVSSKAFDVLVCNSELMKRDLVSRFSLEDKQVEVIYPSFDETGFQNEPEDIRKAVGISQKALVIGLITSGGFEKRNVRFFLDVSAQLDVTQDLHIVVAGNGSPENYRELIAKSKHPVSFLPSIDRVENYYSMLDVFVLPAHIEEFGMSALEAMYFSKPVVLHKQVGASEILEGDSREFILPELKESLMSEMLMRLLNDEALRKSVGALNHQTAKKYTSSEQAKKQKALFESLLVKEP